MAFSQGRWGAEDRSISLTVAKGIARGLGDLPLHIISNAGHAPYDEEPAEFGRTLKSELAAIANQQTDERAAP
jgi:pimeloyl-ACP methyl ester carboxylesterase